MVAGVDGTRRWLDARVGYGAEDAPFWYLGFEEACEGRPEELARRIEGPPLEDLGEAYRRFGVGRHLFEGPAQALQKTWASLLIAHLAATGHGADATRVDVRRRYQATRWGRKDGDSLLTDLLPLPSPTTQTFGAAYRSIGLPELKDRPTYRRTWLPKRIEALRERVRTARRRSKRLHVVAYGRPAWAAFRAVFELDAAATLAQLDTKPAKGTVEIHEEDDLRLAFTWHTNGESSASYWLRIGHWLREGC
jgi:hypothetical protein